MDSAQGEDYPRNLFDCAQFTPDYARNLAKIFAKTFHSTETSQKNTQDRLNIIKLLQKWSANNIGHVPVDRQNYGFLVTTISPTYEDDNVYASLEQKLSQENHGAEKNLLSDVLEYHENKLRRTNARHKRRELLRELDARKLRIDVKLPNVYLPAGCKSSLIRSLLGENVGSRRTFVNCDTEIRNKQVHVAYAMLNLNKTDEDMLLLLKILKRIACYDVLQAKEVEFLSYLWKRFGDFSFSEDVLRVLLEAFGFLYEKPVLNVCREVLKDVSYDFRGNEDVVALKQLCVTYQFLRDRINSMLCDVFILANYNRKLFGIMNFLK